jgi:hypothetical protein
VAARVRVLAVTVVAAAALSVAAAFASTAKAGLIGDLLTSIGGNCPTGGSQVFAPWQDFANYYLAPNGSFEFGTTGWSLSGGAAVASGNEPFYPTGTHSLSLPSGSSALSPTICLGTKQLYVRMFGEDVGGTDAGLRIRVRWYGLLNQVLGITDYAVFAPGQGWSPLEKVNSAGGLAVPLLPIVGSTSARIEVTPLGGGSRWNVDDLYIDPWVNRIG